MPLKKLYNWTLDQAKGAHAERALFFIALIESSFFPLPPDILLVVMVLADRAKWLRYFGICLAGSVIGGAIGYFIGLGLWEAVGPFFLNHIFSQEKFDKVQGLYESYNFWIVFAAGFTPIPYKVFTIAAGVAAINFPIFVFASILGRGGRFIIVSYLLHKFGEPIRTFIDKYFGLVTIAFTILLVAGFYAIKFVLH